MLHKALLGLSASLLMFSINSAQAAISLSATRVIFDAKHQEAALTVRNHGGDDLLLQSWLEYDSTETKNTSFAITPPLSRLSGQGKQQLRILYSGQGAPADRESVVWLNVQEIPQKATGESVLQFAVRQRIKIFFRPAGLTGNAAEAAAQLKWKIEGTGSKTVLQVENPSPFHISLANLDLNGPGYAGFSMDSGRMLSPGTTSKILVKPVKSGTPLKLSYTAINDYGGLDLYKVDLQPKQPTSALPATSADK
ncbi:Periplasmic fimbrial chaperone [Pseudomonas chlororaphis subsp. piscium]|uniref:fimbrial biogenesis chaperone n=1 Tax=Pseudomonas chlororaphis TaxID=587753 RepID=UPI000F57DEF9|nr:molecular chaperone [Pseudomonas chlororaphis]AZC51710.1 Periplasmic fimbrial chaperone [Pseudomonas chlororaphis subsp. piscium]